MVITPFDKNPSKYSSKNFLEKSHFKHLINRQSTVSATEAKVLLSTLRDTELNKIKYDDPGVKYLANKTKIKIRKMLNNLKTDPNRDNVIYAIWKGINPPKIISPISSVHIF